MNRKLTVENFKCFAQKTKMDLGKITVCAGMNSVGKSSLIQSLLLVRQIYDKAFLYRDTMIKDYKIELNGVYGLQLGDSQNIKSSENKEDIDINVDDFKFRLCSMEDQPIQMSARNVYSLKQMEQERGIFSKVFYYLNAERLGPRKYQNISTSDQDGCGVYGENLPFFKQAWT